MKKKKGVKYRPFKGTITRNDQIRFKSYSFHTMWRSAEQYANMNTSNFTTGFYFRRPIAEDKKRKGGK